jgi:hypothetical protein
VLIAQLKLRPYRFQAVHQCNNGARLQEFNIAIFFRRFVREGIHVLDSLFLSDEAWFHLSGYLNSKNTLLWSAENPSAMNKAPLHSLKIGV